MIGLVQVAHTAMSHTALSPFQILVRSERNRMVRNMNTFHSYHSNHEIKFLNAEMKELFESGERSETLKCGAVSPDLIARDFLAEAESRSESTF